MQERLTLVGSGNVARHLGTILKSRGHQIAQVYSRNRDHAKSLADLLVADPIDSFENLDSSVQVFILCIKDDAIGYVSSQMALHLPNNVLLAHTSGVNDPMLLDPYFRHRGLFYPLQSFSPQSLPDWSKIPIFIEGDQIVADRLKQLASTISHRVLDMNDTIRTHLHLASVFANNFTNFNLIIAEKILEQCKVPFDVLEPLMTETIVKAFQWMPINTQTGPAKRFDESTLEKHIRLLVGEFPEYRSLYKKYSQLIQQEFKHAHIGTNPPPSADDQRV